LREFTPILARSQHLDIVGGIANGDGLARGSSGDDLSMRSAFVLRRTKRSETAAWRALTPLRLLAAVRKAAALISSPFHDPVLN